MKLIAITGMHRSNTSAIAKCFKSTGYNLGSKLMPASEHNAEGYFEDLDIIAFEDYLLGKINKGRLSGWYVIDSSKIEDYLFDEKDLQRGRELVLSKIDQKNIFVWKSPRTTLLLNFWKSIFPEIKFIFIFRHYELVSNSLVKRGDMWKFSKVPLIQKYYALRLWMSYNKAILRFLEREKSVLCHSPNCFFESKFEGKLNTELREYLGDSYKLVVIQGNYNAQLLKKQIPEAKLIRFFWPHIHKTYSKLIECSTI